MQHAESAVGMSEASLEQSSALQHKLNEMTDLLYVKQAQLEKLASDKAAVQMALEKELLIVRKDLKQEQTFRNRGPSYDVEDVVPIESIPMYDRLAKRNRRVGGVLLNGARALDLSASTVASLIKSQPVVRLGLFAYLVLLHLFMYFLMARLQNKAVRLDEMGRIQP